ncbi:MAG TPA: carboxypeptidase-like regulatory domain-containing protein, partial [Polyangiales bacterium]
AAAAGVTPNIALSLSFDGRYDRHPGGDSSAVGTPQLGLVAGARASDRIRIGAALQLSLFGRSAPSIDFQAPALSALGLFAWDASRSTSLAAMFGFKVDDSAHAAPDVARLSPADRLSLGLSDFNALPFGVAAIQRIGLNEVAAELSGEILVGAHAPPLQRSPLRASLVGRVPLTTGLSGELALTLGLSQRPSYVRVEPLIPEEPRFTIRLGLRFAPRFDAPPAAPPPPPMAAALTTDLRGAVSDFEGLPLAGVHVSLSVAGRTYQTTSADDGSFSFDALPRGSAKIETEAAGLEPNSGVLALDGPTQALSLQLAHVAVSAQLRGLIRSFAGTPLAATVHVLPAGSTVDADKDGRFMLELGAGEYEVEIECAGYLTQHRKISVQDNGVTLLNVDLHEAPR